MEAFMKNRVLVFSAVTAIVAAFAWGGCSSEDDSNGTAGTAGTAGKAGAAGKAGSAGKAGAAGEAGAAGSTAGAAGDAGAAGSTAGAAGDAGAAGSTAGSAGAAGSTGDCKDMLPDECGTCVETKCCPEGATCKSTTGCLACITGDKSACSDDNEDEATALYDCAYDGCYDECFGSPTVDVDCTAPATAASTGSCVTVGGAIACNPVTGAPCDSAAGEACDINENQDGYQCWTEADGPNTKGLCEECGQSAGAYCKSTFSCVGTCARYCCGDTDCGAGAKCDTSYGFPGGVGICLGGDVDGGTPPADAATDTSTPPADAAAE